MSSKKSQKQQSRSRKRDSTGKTAYLTIGRWQPPHKGHAVLINKTLQLAQENEGHAYVYIYSKEPSREDDWLKNLTKPDFDKAQQEFKIKNPLDLSKRLYYLQKMFPDTQGFSPDIFDFLLGEHGWKRITKKDIRGTLVSPHRHGTMSLDLISYLKKLNYSEVKLVVGSDRIDAFKKYNPDIEIIQAGEDREDAGQGKLDQPIGIISYEINHENNEETLKRLERALSDEDLVDQQPRDAVEFSGSRMREYARTGNTRKFVEGSAIGEMTYQDCLDLMQDVREGMKLELKLGPRTKHHIDVDPEEHSIGVMRKDSQARDDTDKFHGDAQGFVLKGGTKFLKKGYKNKTRKLNKRSRKRSPKRSLKRSPKRSRKRSLKRSPKRSRKRSRRGGEYSKYAKKAIKNNASKYPKIYASTKETYDPITLLNKNRKFPSYPSKHPGKGGRRTKRRRTKRRRTRRRK